jgi:hypothetical protein
MTPFQPADHMEEHGSETATIWVCQGPPRCALEGDDAVAAQENGCKWCRRIMVDGEGETEIKPGEA